MLTENGKLQKIQPFCKHTQHNNKTNFFLIGITMIEKFLLIFIVLLCIIFVTYANFFLHHRSADVIFLWFVHYCFIAHLVSKFTFFHVKLMYIANHPDYKIVILEEKTVLYY